VLSFNKICPNSGILQGISCQTCGKRELAPPWGCRELINALEIRNPVIYPTICQVSLFGDDCNYFCFPLKTFFNKVTAAFGPCFQGENTKSERKAFPYHKHGEMIMAIS